jgi:predicted acyltransferase
MTLQTQASRRIVSLDQFRGYTVAGMLLVNFIGGFTAVPAIFKHHNTYCSYADTIMPQFFFAVGFAYRLTFLRRAQADGYRSPRPHSRGTSG